MNFTEAVRKLRNEEADLMYVGRPEFGYIFSRGYLYHWLYSGSHRPAVIPVDLILSNDWNVMTYDETFE